MIGAGIRPDRCFRGTTTSTGPRGISVAGARRSVAGSTAGPAARRSVHVGRGFCRSGAGDGGLCVGPPSGTLQTAGIGRRGGCYGAAPAIPSMVPARAWRRSDGYLDLSGADWRCRSAPLRTNIVTDLAHSQTIECRHESDDFATPIGLVSPCPIVC